MSILVHKGRRWPIRLVLTAWYLAVLGVILATFSTVLYWQQVRTLSAQTDQSLTAASGEVLAVIDKHVDPIRFVEGDAYRHASLHLGESGHAILLITPTNQVAGRFGKLLDLPIETPAARTLSTVELSSDGSKEQWRVLWQPVIRHDGVVVGSLAVALSANAMERSLNNLFAGLLWAVPIALGLAGIAGYILARLAMRPVDRMTLFARSVGVSGLGRRLDDHGPDDELGRLARTMDDMLSRLQTSFERERRFVADAAHELRTPLTSLKGRIDVLRQRPRDLEAYRATIDSIEPEVERLIRLVRDLLLLARLETSTTAWEEGTVDLSELCEHIAEQMRVLAEERGISIELAVQSGLLVNGSFDHLLRALINLVDNAIKYSDAPGTVTIRGSVLGDSVSIGVCNDGTTLSPRVLEHVGERFLRAETGRSSDTGGAGLGLAITTEIARRHGGSLTLAPRAGGGAEAILTLPRISAIVAQRSSTIGA